MVDPFESLRHDAEETGSTAIDSHFRAELLAEARRRLSATSTDSIRPRVIADTPTPTQMEPITMLAKQPKKTRPILLAAASLAIIVGGIVAVVAVQNDDDSPAPAQQPSVPTSATDPAATTPPTPTQAPTTVASTSTTATTAPSATATDLAATILLSGDEYGKGWTVVPNAYLGASVSSAVAAGIPECTPFVDSVFGAAEQGSNAYRSFYHAEPAALFTQYVAVLPDAATARSVYELVNSAEFAVCATGYGTALAAGASPSAFPSPVDKPISDPPFAPVGEALTFRTFPETWHDGNGVAHGPQTDVDAVMLVGRTVTFIGTVTDGEGGAVLNTDDQFRLALEQVVERANAALNDDR